MQKMCSRCKELKAFTEFSKDKQHASGYKSACKVCSSEDFRKWRNADLTRSKKREKVSQYCSSYGLSKEEANRLVETGRLGTCAICGATTKLVVDHDHKTGKVRGLICGACNSMLGYGRDNPNILKLGAAYLETHNG